MSYIESPVETVAKFVPSWRSSHPKRLNAELISVFNETNRIPDPFRLVYRNGQIVDYEEKKPLRIDRSTYVGRKEGELVDSLTNWLKENDGGSAVWISPLLPGVYPYNKIVLYQIEGDLNGEKSTFNTMLVLETPVEHSLVIASKLNPKFSIFSDPETLRNKLFAVGENFDFSTLLEIASVRTRTKEEPNKEIVEDVMNLIYSGFDPRLVAEKMSQKGLIGKHGLLCPPINLTQNPTFGVFMDAHSLIFRFVGGESGKYVKNCGRCGVKIEAKISKGYKCSKCDGVYEGC